MDETEGLRGILDHLVADLKGVLADGEKLLDVTTKEGDETISALRAKMAEHLSAAEAQLMQAENVMIQKAQTAAKIAEQYVRENPWQSMFFVGGLAVFVGYLMGRSGSSGK